MHFHEHLSANTNNIIEEESICSSHHSYGKIQAGRKNKYPSVEMVNNRENKMLAEEKSSAKNSFADGQKPLQHGVIEAPKTTPHR